MTERIIPNGECWCGCHKETSLGKFFQPGDDRFSEAAIVKMKYGDVVRFMRAHGYGPGLRNLREDWNQWITEHGKK